MNTEALESDVALAKNGDELAFARVVEQCANNVCSIALAIVRNVHASEDVAQEAFLAAWSGLHKLRSAASFLPWLRQITRNQAHLWLREHRREIPGDTALSLAVDTRPGPHEALLESEEQRVLRDVLGELPADAREVILLYYREGSSARAVADLLDLTEDSVKQRLSRARTKIRSEVMERFGSAARETAPRAAFVAAVAGALTTAAPTAGAALTLSAAGNVAAGSSSHAALAVLKGSMVGALGGIAGILVGMQYLEPAFDEQEQAELQRFRTVAIFAMLLSSFGLAVSVLRPGAFWKLGALAGFLLVMAWLFGRRLPAILERRMRWEREMNPELAAQHERRWIWATIAQTVGAVAGGSGIMLVLLKSFAD